MSEFLSWPGHEWIGIFANTLEVLQAAPKMKTAVGTWMARGVRVAPGFEQQSTSERSPEQDAFGEVLVSAVAASLLRAVIVTGHEDRPDGAVAQHLAQLLVETLQDGQAVAALMDAVFERDEERHSDWRIVANDASAGFVDVQLAGGAETVDELLAWLPRAIAVELRNQARSPNTALAGLARHLPNDSRLWPPTPLESNELLDRYLAGVVQRADTLPFFLGRLDPERFAGLHRSVKVRTKPGDNPGTDAALGYRPARAGEDTPAGRLADWDDVAGDVDNTRLVVLGEPGYGKSWLLRRHARTLAARAQTAVAAGEREGLALPVWLRLDMLAKRLDGRPTGRLFVERLLDALAEDQPQVDDPAVRAELHRRIVAGEVVLLLDALDEVDATGRDRLTVVRSWLATDPVRGKVRVVVTSRPAGLLDFQVSLVGPATHVELVAFDDEPGGDVEEFVHAWCGDPGDARQLLSALRANPPVAQLARVPLLLTLLCSLAVDPGQPRDPALPITLPARRSELYKKVIDQLAAGHYRRDAGNDRLLAEGITARRTLAEHLAYAMAADNSNDDEQGWRIALPASRLENLLRGIGAPYEEARQVTANNTAAEVLVGLADDGLLIADGPGTDRRYRFLHLTFQEALAAAHLAVDPDDRHWTPQARSRHPQLEWPWSQLVNATLLDPAWREVISLLPGQMIAQGRPRHARAVLDHLLVYQPDPFSTALHHAGRAATELPNHPDTTAQIHQVAIGLVRLLPAQKAWQTLYSLVPIHPGVLPPLIARLTDDNDSVRWAAVEALAGSVDPRAVDGLLARLTHDNGWVREAAVEALAGSADMARSALEQLIRSRFLAGRSAWESLEERVAPTVPLVARVEWTARVLTAAATRSTERRGETSVL